jgi:atypical dual specificity phosphatase
MTEFTPFTWIEADRLIASSYPHGAEDWARLRGAGVTMLLNLTEEPHQAGIRTTLGITEIHIPVQDMSAPKAEQIDAAITAIRSTIAQSGVVAVHCHAGLGRTGTVLACWFVAMGAGAEEAVARVRSLRPGSVETEEQEAAVHAYAERISEHQPAGTKDTS